ncbi:FmdB family zinc ribbon protein [Arthrobacter agilis]|jgi:putative FmdB family regulatory protein|uniref:FmdB family zinc ribbon protein n=1 Tax=Arthrobacter agilis TaxID=37921 RepID=UPI0027804625|nr:zinc ribbon domain-containing protein [Arthrobacter agilis]MDQ0736551.1 putative FmdB family regulatory protein [Arthrobacter agilis]
MPIYEYRCPRCDVFEVVRAMGAAPGVDACPTCGEPARRRFTAPHLARTGTAAFQLIDATHRSASEPQVVSGPLPSAGAPRTQPFSSNPLHRKLPRP